jgi:CYTH domain-containing protein
MEIERKFIVPSLPADVALGDGIELRQGYLATTPVEVRVRSSGQTALVLTVKGPGSLQRVEVELPLDPARFDELWPLTEGRRIEKVRHRIPFGNTIVELDRYRGAHEGLLVAEVEFANVEDAAAFEPPEWFGAEVTDDPRFKNKELAAASAPPTS